MNNGLKPKTQFIIVILIAVACFAFLVSRPKTVVNVGAVVTPDQEEGAVNAANMHVENPEADRMANEIRKKYATDANPLNSYKELGQMFYKATIFDSSAYYFEKIALSNPGIQSWSQAGDVYLQAFGLALNPVKMEQMAEKARGAYAQVLKYDESNLHAKTSSALTYVNSQNPMRAITVLREVLDLNPNYIPAILSMGKLSLQSSQFDKAVERFKAVLKIDVNNIDAKIGLSYSYIELGQINDAKALLQEVVVLDIDPIVKEEITKTLNSLN